MSKKTKKMKAKAKKEEVYASLTKEQFETLERIIRWDNSVSDLKSLTTNGDMSQIEIGFKLGEIHSAISNSLSTCEEILEKIEPPYSYADNEEDNTDEEPTFDWDEEDEEVEEEN